MKNKKRTAIIMVHPFDSPEYETQEDYLTERNQLLERESNLYVLTNQVKETQRRLESRKAVIIPTSESNPKPRIGWKKLTSMLKNYNELVFCGAELHLKDNGKPYTGCVLDAFQKVSHPNKWMYLAACWIGE